MRKRTKLKTALLLAATVNVSYAAEVCFPPTEGQEFYEVLQCFQNGLDSQQKQITELKKENQRLVNIVEAQLLEKEQLQRQIAEMKKEIATRYVEKRYIDNGNGTVTDTRNELIWLKNANCFGTQNWKTAKRSAARLRSGQCGLRDGSKAGMWRLPTRDELVTMVDNRYKNPALSNRAGTAQWKEGDAFSGVQTDVYWSSTEAAGDAGYAWYVPFSRGDVYTSYKTSAYYVWPVRRRQ